MQGPQEGRRREHELAREVGEVGGDESLDLEEGHVEEDHLAEEVKAATPGAAAHLAIHEAVELEGVAAEDGRAARHVDAQGQRPGREDHPEVATAEEDLDGLAVVRLAALVVHADAALEGVDEVVRRVPVLQALQLLLDVLLPLAQRLGAVEGELHVDLLGDVHGRLRLRHSQVLGAVHRLALVRAPALALAVLPGGRVLLLLAGPHLLRLLVGHHLGLVIGHAPLHDPLRAVGRLLGAVVLVRLLVLELLDEPLEHPLDLLPGEVEEDGRQALHVVQATAEPEERGGLQVRGALDRPRQVEGLGGGSFRVALGLLARRRRELGAGFGRAAIELSGLLQGQAQLGEAITRDGLVLQELQERCLQLLLIPPGVQLGDESALMACKILLGGQAVPCFHAAHDPPDLLKELDHLLRRKREVRAEAILPHRLLYKAAEGMQGSKLAPGPDKLVKVVPTLCVDNAIHSAALLLRVDVFEPRVEEAGVRHCGGERYEWAGYELHAMLPLGAALLFSDAVHLIEDDPLQALHPLLVGRREQ
mmetsp:Transcript_16994/g.53581  ORF Transcript_16994/g.53581 Transcript_16994/m.53581 type:complete len:534 (-) Transcript_16994:689-2290(-)